MPSGGIQRAVSLSIPAPVGGWNTRDPLAAMPPQDAIRLENWFPDTNNVSVRKGYREHADAMGSGSVEHLHNYVGADGTEKLIAFANNNIYNATTLGANASSLHSSGITSNRWSTINFSHTMVCCNGADQPLQYDGSTVSTAAYTGIADDSTLVHVSSYKNRLYFTEVDSGSVWYGGVDSITGALTEFDVSSVLERGGYISSTTAWNFDAGDGINAYFVMISNMGEVLVYSGSYPGDSAWKLISHAFIGKPLGRNCYIRLSSEMSIITDEGVIPLSQLFAETPRGSFQKLSDKINSAFTDAASLYRDNYGWRAVHFPEGKYVAFNIPVSSSQFDQYIMNTFTGAWSHFRGLDGPSWVVHNNSLYFGGTDGKVYQAHYEYSDDGGEIAVDLKTAFNYFGNANVQKRFSLTRPLFVANGSIRLQFAIDTDFADEPITSSVTVTGTLGTAWDAGDWDATSWGTSNVHNTDWYRIAGIGRSGAMRVLGNLEDVVLSLSAFDVSYVPGGLV